MVKIKIDCVFFFVGIEKLLKQEIKKNANQGEFDI